MEKLDTNISEEGRSCHLSEHYKQIYLSLTYSIIFVLGLPLNGAVLWLSWRQTKRWGCATIYLANLMVADLLYISTLPFLIVTYSLDDTWPFGELLCKLVRFLFYANLYSSVLLLIRFSPDSARESVLRARLALPAPSPAVSTRPFPTFASISPL